MISWTSWTVKRLAFAGFAAVAAVFLILGGMTWSSLKGLQALPENIGDSSEILHAVGELNSAMQRMVAVNRLYIAQPSPELAAARIQARRDVKLALDKTTQVTKNNPLHQPLVKQLHELVAKRSEVTEFYTALWRKEGVAGILRQYGKAEPIDAQFQDTLQKIRTQEMRLLKQDQEMAAARLHRAQVSSALLMSALAVFLIGIFFLIYRHIRRDETRAALEKSEAVLRQTLELLPVGVFVVDKQSRFTLANPAVHEIWGTSSKQEVDSFDFPAWRLETGEKVARGEYAIQRALQHGEVTRHEEFEIERADGGRRIIRSSAMPLRDHRQQIIGAITVNLDITDLKQAQSALQAAHDALEARVAMRTRELVTANEQLRNQIEERRRVEEALRATQSTLTRAQQIAHIGSWERNLTTNEVKWSDEIYRIFGLYPGEEPASLELFFDFIHPDDRSRVREAIRQAHESWSGIKLSYRILRRNGVVRHVMSQSDIVDSRREGKPAVLIGCLLDMTEQVQNEEMLRQLAAHQEQVKEEERKRIAREIHDEMGQNLLAFRIDLSILHAQCSDVDPALRKKLDTMLESVDNTIKSVRTIVNNLRPVVLDLGLYAAIQWQINEFQRRTSIACELDASQADLDCGLSDEQITALFRVLQESLTNVARHANAQHVYVGLRCSDDSLIMTISDDGVGIYPGDRRKPKTFGLLGMRERISALGGTLTLDSEVGQGTNLRLAIPLASSSAAISVEAAPRKAQAS